MTGSALQVAMFTPWRVRCGISDYSKHLVAALSARDEIAGVRVIEAPPEARRDGIWKAVRAFAADEAQFQVLGEQMNGEGADVAHVQHQYFFFGGVAPHKNHARAFLHAIRTPLVMTVHEIVEPAPSASYLTRRALEFTNRGNLLSPSIRALIVHTERDRERLIALGAKHERIHVIPVGVPAAEPMPDSIAAKKALGLEGRSVITLFGFLSTKKGHRLAVEAVRHMPEEVVLLLAGDQHPDDHSDYVPDLKAYLHREGLKDRVRITGYLPEPQIPVLMAATDAAVAPYLQSSGSASLAHLFAYGRAIVASDIPPHREIAASYGDCLALFRSEDAEGLRAILQNTLQNAARRKALQSAALHYAHRHSYPNMAAATVEVYHQVIAAV